VLQPTHTNSYECPPGAASPCSARLLFVGAICWCGVAARFSYSVSRRVRCSQPFRLSVRICRARPSALALAGMYARVAVFLLMGMRLYTPCALQSEIRGLAHVAHMRALNGVASWVVSIPDLALLNCAGYRRTAENKGLAWRCCDRPCVYLQRKFNRTSGNLRHHGVNMPFVCRAYITAATWVRPVAPGCYLLVPVTL
jgi:hypothetical protein